MKSRGLKIAIVDLTDSVEDVSKSIQGFEIIISTIGAPDQLEQIKLVDAAASVGVKRFIPCGFTTICPPGYNVMKLRDDKEKVYQRIWYHRLPYTIVDVGFWHQISWPRLPSGKIDYAYLQPQNTIFGDGNTPNILTDKRDMGRFVARILKDGRTLNQKVFTHSDVLSQNEIVSILEKKSGEKLEMKQVSSIAP